jgi:hypothetical protein
MSEHVIVYSYLMGVDAIDQSICPEVLGMTKCSIAWGQCYVWTCNSNVMSVNVWLYM